MTDPHLNPGLLTIIDPKYLRKVILHAMTKTYMEIALSSPLSSPELNQMVYFKYYLYKRLNFHFWGF